MASLRAAFGLVSQEPLLFDYSIKENIAYGIPEATDLQIHEAAKNSNALEFINRFSKDGISFRNARSVQEGVQEDVEKQR